ncbi:MAG: type II toxin-antitoxin system VapC family toxin [Thaumarchaeota archaeon]|nr:type II toxin-antitoxin system VapC family toxin [Nitrososphaerota archaeon]
MIVIDTTVAVDFLRGRGSAVATVESALKSGEVVGLSTVSAFELLHPIYNRKLVKHGRLVRSFFKQARLLPLDEEAAEESAKIMGRLLRSGAEVNALDVLIAGSALAGGAERLVSGDGDFERIAEVSDLKVDMIGAEDSTDEARGADETADAD